MIPLLAETTTPPADALKDWLLVLGFLVGIGVGVKKLITKGQPQPFVVKADAAFVTAEVHDKAIGEIKQELLRHAARRAEIYQQNNAMSAQVAALEEKTDLTHAQVNRLDGKIDRILERLPRRSHDS